MAERGDSKAVHSTAARDAAHWFLRIQQGTLSEDEQARFAAWRADPQHAAAFAKAKRTWDAVGGVAADPEVLRVREQVLARGAWRRFWRTAGVAAAVAILTVGVLLLTNAADSLVAAFRAVFAEEAESVAHSTSIGERSTVTLRDGSLLTLNTDSAAEVTFDGEERRVVLTRGQALFKVAKDKAHPFVVRAGDRRIVAVGTAFDVRLDAGRVAVTLVEGRVRVGEAAHEPRDAQPIAPGEVELNPGERLIAEPGRAVSIAAADVDQITSWASGKLMFADVRLDEAIAEVNRYTRTPITLRSDSLAGLHINGVFRAGQPAEFARAIAQIHPLDVDYQTNGDIVLTAKSP